MEENAHLAVDPKEATSPHPIHTVSSRNVYVCDSVFF